MIEYGEGEMEESEKARINVSLLKLLKCLIKTLKEIEKIMWLFGIDKNRKERWSSLS